MLEAEITENHIPSLVRSLPGLFSQALRKSAFDVERLAKEAAPTDTGSLRNSIYVSVTGGGGDYAEAVAGARAVNPHAVILDEVPATEDLTAVVAVGVEHGIFVEYPTERTAAQPFLGPALDRVRPLFEEAVRQAARKAAG